MNCHINRECGRPMYLQLYEYLKHNIVTGAFPYGAKLPSKRTLAEETGISVITVQHAYEILCEEGYLEGKQRSGYVVIYKDSDFVFHETAPAFEEKPAFNRQENAENSRKAENGRTAENCSIEETATESSDTGKTTKARGEFPFSVLSKTMRKVLLDYGDEILIKSPNHGCPNLRAAISSYLKRSNGMEVAPEQIIIGSGAEYLYSLLAQLFGKNRMFGLEYPSYEKIRRVYEANGVCCDMLRLGTDGIKTSELARTNAQVLHVTPFNSFPSGITADVSKRREYLTWAAKKNGYIIEDNYAAELTVSMKNDDTIFSMAKEESVIYLNTFSETIAPSMRVGYLVLPKKLLPEFEKTLGFYSCTVPVFEQYVLAELLDSGDFERHINRVRRKRRKRKS